jgi:hypothetical protein
MTDHRSSIATRRAVVLFVRNERREAQAKPLPARYRAAGYSALNSRVAGRLRSLSLRGVDLIVVGDRALAGADYLVPQRGRSFGERIANAIADTAALGYDEIALVGNDCPTITMHDVTAAFERLDRGSAIVAAPARDGGAFLIAVRPHELDRDRFVALPWCTSLLFDALLSMHGAAALDVVRDDFDSWHDRAAQSALDILFATGRRELSRPLPALPLPQRSRRKALTRIFLTAPPRA